MIKGKRKERSLNHQILDKEASKIVDIKKIYGAYIEEEVGPRWCTILWRKSTLLPGKSIFAEIFSKLTTSFLSEGEKISSVCRFFYIDKYQIYRFVEELWLCCQCTQRIRLLSREIRNGWDRERSRGCNSQCLGSCLVIYVALIFYAERPSTGKD